MSVIVLDMWASPFAMRVKLALVEKGVEFEAREEDLLGAGKSELLLQSNPIYKKVPVLIHDGKPVCESLVILGYIEGAWSAPALLPQSPYERSVALFWADFTEKKLFEAGSKIWKSKGEAQEAAKKEFVEVVKVLEGVLGEDDYFGGESFGFLDVVIVPLTSWFYAYEKCGGFKVEDECPKFTEWMTRCGARESVAKVLPDPDKVYGVVCTLKTMNGIE